MAAEAETITRTAEAHKPYISASTVIPEFTPRAVILGALFGVIFGASTVYLGLKTGLTVSASIPIAVLSITLLRMLGRSTILENNIVQTTGSAGESIAGGIVFTIPALLILGLDLDVLRTSLIALTGGLLGTLLMIPLRRSLIVKEHANLPYPEGTACAEVLVAGEKGGSDAKTVFMGFGVGLVYKFLMLGFKFWKEKPDKILTGYQNSRIAAEISPELLGVGYIIGPRTASYMLGGGVMAALILTPIIKFFGAGLTTNIFPAGAGELIGNMSAGQVFDRYVRYIAAGAVATGGIISLLRSLPTIARAFTAGAKDFSGGGEKSQSRTERDIPIPQAMLGVLGVAILIWALPKLQVDLLSTVLIVVFGFFFVTVSSRITGQIGTSANPISGMTIAALLFTSLIYLGLGRSGADWRVVALTVGAIVCVAAANAGGTSQDLKTGFLVGGTPKFQQFGLIIGVVTSATVVGWTLLFLNDSYLNILPRNYPAFTANAAELGSVWDGRQKPEDGKSYRTLALKVEADAGDGKSKIPAGKYLIGDDNKIHYLVNPGVGGLAEGLSDNKLGDLKNRSFTVGQDAKLVTSDVRGLDDKMYRQVSVSGVGAKDRTFLIDESGKPHYEVDEITKLEAPKAALMGILVDGVLTQRLPWSLIIIGAFISIVLEILGLHALPVAVGIYLPISTSATIFVGGMVRALVTKLMNRENRASQPESLSEEETGKGVLLSSGLIAGGAIGGLVVSVARVVAENAKGMPGKGEQIIGIGDGSWITSGPWSNIFALMIFAGLVWFVISIARKRSV